MIVKIEVMQIKERSFRETFSFNDEGDLKGFPFFPVHTNLNKFQ